MRAPLARSNGRRHSVAVLELALVLFDSWRVQQSMLVKPKSLASACVCALPDSARDQWEDSICVRLFNRLIQYLIIHKRYFCLV